MSKHHLYMQARVPQAIAMEMRAAALALEDKLSVDRDVVDVEFIVNPSTSRELVSCTMHLHVQRVRDVATVRSAFLSFAEEWKERGVELTEGQLEDDTLIFEERPDLAPAAVDAPKPIRAQRDELASKVASLEADLSRLKEERAHERKSSDEQRELAKRSEKKLKEALADRDAARAGRDAVQGSLADMMERQARDFSRVLLLANATRSWAKEAEAPAAVKEALAAFPEETHNEPPIDVEAQPTT